MRSTTTSQAGSLAGRSYEVAVTRVRWMPCQPSVVSIQCVAGNCLEKLVPKIAPPCGECTILGMTAYIITHNGRFRVEIALRRYNFVRLIYPSFHQDLLDGRIARWARAHIRIDRRLDDCCRSLRASSTENYPVLFSRPLSGHRNCCLSISQLSPL